jgi:hypothetical protein
MTRHFVWAVLLAAVGAATAAAGPMNAGLTSPPHWTLSAAVTQVYGDGRLYLGTFNFPDGALDGGPGAVLGTAALPTGLGTTQFMGDAANVRVASVGKGSYTLTDDALKRALPVMDTVFTLKLTVTDTASGAAGDLTFTGRPILLLGPTRSSPHELALGFDGAGTGSLTLGGRRYEVSLDTAESDSGSYLVADVSPARGTPEPATLALAGVGLLGVVVLRRRQNRHSQPSVSPCIQ